MTECRLLPQDYPQRCALKIIGREGELDPARLIEQVAAHLGPQPEADRVPGAKRKGPYISYTLWVTLADETQEKPLREALHQLPGVVMQL
jgi:putative lipoic acid-binding regulatory protein